MKLEDIQKDYESFLDALNKHEVDYLIIGSHAAMFYGQFARFSKDMDLWVRQSENNIKRLSDAVCEYSGSSLPENYLMIPKQKIEIGNDDFKIEIMTYMEGIDFDNVWQKRVADKFGSVKVNFVPKDVLIQMKELAGRPKDILDLEQLKSDSENTNIQKKEDEEQKKKSHRNELSL